MKGYTGRSLRVDLGAGQVWTDELDSHQARKHIGGRGFAAKILFEEMEKGVDPLSPENRLIFSSGLLAGSNLPANTRFVVAGKSPLTGIYGEANAAGWFSREMKRAGYDMIVVQGRAERPVYLWIHGGEVEIKDALHLWGKMTGETEDLIKAELDKPKAQVVCIGPAGERLVKFAGIMHAKHRAAARTGLGALMGAKNLKAIVLSGSQRAEVASPELLQEIRAELVRYARELDVLQLYGKHGTAVAITGVNDTGTLPTRNFAEGVFERYDKLTGEVMTETILKGTSTCPGCPIACHRRVEITSGPFAPVSDEYGGPEYETIAAFGSLLDNDNLESIARAHQICNMNGLDTISAGLVVGWAMECYERGILSRSDLDGINLRWGNAEAMLQVLERICRREGIGDLLAEGTRTASQQVGQGSERFAFHVKGLEIALHDPRGKKGVGLGYAVSPRGGSHLDLVHDPAFENDENARMLGLTRGVDRFATEGKAQLEKMGADIMTVLDSIGACGFLYYGFYGRVPVATTAKAVSAITGWDFTEEEFVRVGERNNNLARAFNVREGTTRADDRLPYRLMNEVMTKGLAQGQMVTEEELARMLDEYYHLRGWTPEGMPTAAKLAELGLSEVAQELTDSGLIGQE